jgi:protein O-GlcNAc transferase
MSGQEIADKIAVARKHFAAQEFHQAEALAREVLAAAPGEPSALLLMGLLASIGQRPDVALDLLQRAAAIAPNDVDIAVALANVFMTQGQAKNAIAPLREALRIDPQHAAALYSLGLALSGCGDVDGAIGSFERFIALRPGISQGHSALGDILHFVGRHDQAIAAYERARALGPLNAETHYRLGGSYLMRGKLDEAITNFNHAIAMRPDYTEAFNMLGNALGDRGEAENALAAYRVALKINPDLPSLHSNMLLSMHFLAGLDSAALYKEYRAWNDRHAKALSDVRAVHTNDRNPDRRLRIGYVSPDFCGHCQALFTAPLLANHDHRQVEVFCYSGVAKPDDATRYLRGVADQWRDTVGKSDQQIADLIREDQIDIAVDLTMHMSGGRPLLFARRPAPVRMAWLAYPGTTGLDAMDWRLSDPYLDPPGAGTSGWGPGAQGPHDRYYSERTYRLPHTFWCYGPAIEMQVNELPAASAGHVVFGCLNNFCKINSPLLALWGKVMMAVPNSRLLLLAPEGEARRRVLTELGAQGVKADRVEFVPRQPRPAYLQTYHRIDMGIDTLPANGHTTSLDSYWMGVPVVTLVGQTSFGRAGLSQLTNLGLPELIAHSEAEFISIIRDLAGDLPRLAELRRTLRQRMEASPLMDAKAFARDMEAAYRYVWREWCGRR